MLLINSKSIIKIEENCVIISSNKGYHINMHDLVKLYADRPNTSIITGAKSRINNVCIHTYSTIKIGGNCLIVTNTQIIDVNGHEMMMGNPEKRIYSTDHGKKYNLKTMFGLEQIA
jgi:hypothetical protein